jgi:hypothetical protein
MALAQLDLIDHTTSLFIFWPIRHRKSHLAIALGVEAVRAGRSVYFSCFVDISTALLVPSAKAACANASANYRG